MLHLDHKNNDGCKHRKKHSKAGGVHTYSWVLKHPTQARKRLQILCANHDRVKQRLGSIDAIVALAIGTVVVAAVALVDRKVENCP